MIFLFYIVTRYSNHILFHGTNSLLLLACPIQGQYGVNCSTLCPENCLEGLCDIVQGTCFECVNGYKGPTCEGNC